MPRAEWSWRRLAGRAVVAALLVLAAIPGYLTLTPSWRPAAVRLSCALLVAIACARARRWARDAAGPYPTSPLDAPSPAPPAPVLDARFRGLRDDLIYSTRSRRYFDVILWPRLGELGGSDLARPPERRVLRRRGPSLRTLEDLIALTERRT